MNPFAVYLISLLKICIMQPEPLVSFIPVSENSEFPLENIPFGVFSPKDRPDYQRPATRIGINFIMQVIRLLTFQLSKMMDASMENYLALIYQRFSNPLL